MKEKNNDTLIEDFSNIGKTSVFEISDILREFYTTNKHGRGSGFAIRLLQALVEQVSESQRIIYQKPEIMDLARIISFLEKTNEEKWCVEVVKKAGSSCLFGHLFDYGGNYVWNMFEAMYATTYMVYPVNDGENQLYQQHTPKQRVIAYLKNMLAGNEKTTQQLWDECDNQR